MAKLPIAVQLYTLRDDTAKDFAGTIAKVAEIGYSGVELAGYGALTVQSLKSVLDDAGLRIAGSHVGLDSFADIGKVIDENLSLNNHIVVIPWLGNDLRNVDGYKATAEKLNEYGETLRSHSLTLAYHHHAFEFEKLPSGERGIDILLGETDPAFVKLEVDTYWALVGGDDPVAFLKKHTRRVPLIHLKDRDLEDGSFAEVGTGDLPLDAIMETAPAIGASWLIVEQDICKRPPLESIAISLNNLKAKGYG